MRHIDRVRRQYDKRYVGHCPECDSLVIGFAWADGDLVGFALPCGHHTNPRIVPLKSAEIAAALLLSEET